MKLLLCVSIAMAAAVQSAPAAPSTPSPSTSGKEPWLWTTEERIAKRINPAERDARKARSKQAGHTNQAGWTPIAGNLEPELFLPVELVTRLVLATKQPNALRRGMYRDAIVSRGWEPEKFWAELDVAAAPYLSLMEQSAVLQQQTHGRADLTQLAPLICAAAADLLAAAYDAFEQQRFDEFLYGRVAPPIRTWIADHADTAERLRDKSKGCR